jgi:methylthioribose-1-phosphate isomerase
VFDSDDLCSLRPLAGGPAVEVIDQTLLPHQLSWVALASTEQFCHAISAMQVRGAPLIGITAAFGLAHALAQDASDAGLADASEALLATRPTAVNLRWALEQVADAVQSLPADARPAAALRRAIQLRGDDIANCERIGEHGLQVLRQFAGEAGDGALNIMTHCNAGFLATVQWGTALAPVYKAQAAGLPVHVWVSETRPRNQGMNLTAWELQRAGVPCTVVADNSCGQLMQSGKVDCVIVGSDRTARNGDVCNKIGTYLKALAARDNSVPFYVALPESTIDWRCPDGAAIPIEERGSDEVLYVAGFDGDAGVRSVRLSPDDAVAANPAFDTTPATLVAGLITEHGVFDASREGLGQLAQKLGY